jgi:hypothetical protein
VEDKLHDCVAEDMEYEKHQRGKIKDDLASMRQVPEKIRATKMSERGTTSVPKGEATMSTRTTPQTDHMVHTTVHASNIQDNQ